MLPVQGPSQIVLVYLDLLNLIEYTCRVVDCLALFLLYLLLGPLVWARLIFVHSNFSFGGGTRLLNLTQTFADKRDGLVCHVGVLLGLLVVTAEVSHEALVVPTVSHLVSSALEVDSASSTLNSYLELFS